MAQHTIFADENIDPQAPHGFGTQALAFLSAACVGIGLFFSSLLLGIALFAIVLVTMNVDAGSGWITRTRQHVASRRRPILRHVVSPQ